MAQNVYPVDPTVVVAIIGDGKRDEILVNRAKGEGLDGEPVDYNINNQPDGRHFKLSAYPVFSGSIEVIRKTRSRVSLEDESSDVIEPLFYNEPYGYIVLKYPLEAGEQLRVKYKTTFDQVNARLFDSSQLSQIYTLYGPQSLTNTISMGATIAFGNGAPYVLCVSGSDLSKDPSWSESFKILANEFPYYVVPLPPQEIDNGFPIPESPTGRSTYTTLVQTGLAAVEEMSKTANRNESVLVAGETGHLTVEEAKSILGNSERALFAGPKSIQYFVQGQLQTLDGRFLAPALAGFLAGVQLTYSPMNKLTTNVKVQNIYKKSSVELGSLVRNGVSYFLPAGEVAKLYRPIMTNQSRNPILEEPTVLRAKDYLINILRAYVAKQYVGTTIQVGIEKSINLGVTRFLDVQVSRNLITEYKNLIVKQDSVEPRQINISFDFEPIFPLIFINISFDVLLF